jgi:SAM-dependent methyltransferase
MDSLRDAGLTATTPSALHTMTAMAHRDYVHGYSPQENQRLLDQASTLAELLHADTVFAPGADVLEAGCGVGAQTITIAPKNPHARIRSIDVSPSSLAAAKQRIAAAGITNVTFQQGDIFNLPFASASFDHVLVCFVLEHLSDPLAALSRLKAMVKPGGTLTAIEGDHGSTYFHPRDDDATRAVQCLVDVQAAMGGDALVGRRLYPLLTQAGLAGVAVSPRMVYVDASKPRLVDGFTVKTFIAMVDGVREQAIARGLADAAAWDRGMRGLHRTTEPDGVFCYTFFKGVGAVPA